MVRLSLRSPALLRHLLAWLVPTAPEPLRAQVEARQWARLREQVPMIYLLTALNTFIVMGVCAHTGIEPRYYTWMLALIVLAVVRTTTWTRTTKAELAPAAVTAALRRSAWVSVASLLVMGTFASATFVTGVFARSTLIPISLAFGSMSIAHCFATLRPSAVMVLVLGIGPSSAALLLVGDFNAQMLGVSMLSVALLMIRFVAGQYDQLVTELQLQREVHDLANTDALTALPNRRALVALVEQELAQGAGNSFAVALLDLDGFKGVNDRLGHLAGDALLRVVGRRLAASCGQSGTAGRLGGDEFLVLFRAVQSPAELDARITTLLAELCQPTNLGTGAVPVRASLGASLFPRDGQTTPALLAAADEALYANKRTRTGADHGADGDADGGDSAGRRRHRTG